MHFACAIHFMLKTEVETRQKREKERSKREIKRTSVENDCLFEEG